MGRLHLGEVLEVETLHPHTCLVSVPALNRLNLFQRLLWVLGLLVAVLMLLLVLGTCYTCRWGWGGRVMGCPILPNIPPPPTFPLGEVPSSVALTLCFFATKCGSF